MTLLFPLLLGPSLIAQPLSFDNHNFEFSTNCDPTACLDAGIKCIDGWWNNKPSALNETAWIHYVCANLNSCGDLRGLQIGGQDDDFLFGATNNPAYNSAPGILYSIGLDIIISPAHSDPAYVWIWGTNTKRNGALDLLGTSSVEVDNNSTCHHLDILVGNSVDISQTGMHIGDYEYLVFSLSNTFEQTLDPPADVNLNGVIDNVTICEVFRIETSETECGTEVCTSVFADNECYAFQCMTNDCSFSVDIRDAATGQVIASSSSDGLETSTLCADIVGGQLLEIEYYISYELAPGRTYVFQYIEYFQSKYCSDQVVSSNSSWNSSNVPNGGILGEVRVESGYKLIIESDLTISFCEGGRLLIEPGAEVELHGTLTSAECGSNNWTGVKVDGDGVSSQDYVNGYIQGYFESSESAEISNALIGISNRGAKGAGGIIKCTGTQFTNCRISVRMYPFSNSSYFTGSPRSYNASFRDCQFHTSGDFDKVFSDHFYAFIYLNDVHSIPFAGCSFINEFNDPDATQIHEFGTGILSVQSGFRAVSSAQNVSEFYGLGYGVRSARYSGARPYYISEAIFEDCFVGVAGSFTSFGSIVNNRFELGTVPDATVSDAQCGIKLVNNQIGIQIEENRLFSDKSNAAYTIGIICDNLGDMNNVIYHNWFTGDFYAGNQMTRQNSLIDNFQDRGLWYECNENYQIDQYDFFAGEVPPTSIRNTQGRIINEVLTIASGNKFSRSGNPSVGDFFGNFGLGSVVSYHFNEKNAVLEEPINYNGIASVIPAEENLCPVVYCSNPPCITQAEISVRKADYYNYKMSHQQATTARDTIGAAYYQQKLDEIASSIAEYYMYDTLPKREDSLRAWYSKMESVTGELLLAGQYMAEGDAQQAIAELNTIGTRYQLTSEQSLGITELIKVYTIIDTATIDSLSTSSINDLSSIALSKRLASSHAQAILVLNGVYFDPEYELNEGRGHQRIDIQPTKDVIYSQQCELVQLYPNPNEGIVYISLNYPMGFEENVQLIIYGMQGRILKLLEIEQGSNRVDLKQFGVTAGLYGYKIIEDDGTTIKSGKFVVE